MDSPEVHAFVLRWFDSCDFKFLFNPLAFNVKTHKPDGKVSVRVIHDAGRSPLGGLAHVCKRVLHQALVGLKHIAFSTQDVIEQLTAVHVGASDRLVTADVENFFMDASHDFLLDTICAEPSFRHLRAALELLLAEQYVCTRLFGYSARYQVIRGSGMGTDKFRLVRCCFSFGRRASAH
jgi:hypothetical protein